MLLSLKFSRLIKFYKSSSVWIQNVTSREFSNLNTKQNEAIHQESSGSKMEKILLDDFNVKIDFITPEEEELLMKEIEPTMKRLKYEFSHWDDAIHGFRETEKSSWTTENSALIERIREHAFSTKVGLLPHVHVLDLAKDGYIKPHVDSIKFCGDIIAGLSLLSASVMRLQCSTDSQKWAKVQLPRRSLYTLKDRLRYKFTHEILKDSESYVNEVHIPRDRRISVMCRKNPAEK